MAPLQSARRRSIGSRLYADRDAGRWHGPSFLPRLPNGGDAMRPSSAAVIIPGICAALALGACGSTDRQSPAAGYGPTPYLPEPETSLIPTVNVAKVVG